MERGKTQKQKPPNDHIFDSIEVSNARKEKSADDSDVERGEML